MSSGRSVRTNRLVGWISTYIVIALGVIAALYVLTGLPNLGSSWDVVYPWFETVLLILVAMLIVAWLADHVFKTAKEQDKSIDERLLGFVLTNDAITFDQLAAWARIGLSETADRLAKLASKGSLNDFAIDLTNRMVVRVQRQQSASGPPSASSVTVQPKIPPVGQPVVESDESIRVKAKLYELEILKQQGKIGEPAYNKLKEEYEKKLAQSDKGTQVY